MEAESKAGTAAPQRLWGGRFASGPSVDMDRLNRSLPIDRRMWREDIEGSRAWAAALGRAGVLTEAESVEIAGGLRRVSERLARWSPAQWDEAMDEDIHSLVERLLRDEIGPLAGKLHTGRSRNDQVATDTRLWAMSALEEVDRLVGLLQAALLRQAERNVATVMPSYTHLQRAQPISAAHWILSHAWALSRDRARLRDARRRVAVLPLGSGAIAGCPFPIDRAFLRDELGFDQISPNSIDAVGDRDWIAELLFCFAAIGIHLSRLAEDLILFGSSEFAFVHFSDEYSTGSSLMPQKRNPDAMELARGKSGRLVGGLTAVLLLLKGLPTGYNKDLQEDKEALFDAVDTLQSLIPAVIGTVDTLTFVPERCAAAVDPSMLATDVADALVRTGVPFREAHERVGLLIRAAEESRLPLSELPSERFLEIAPELSGTKIENLFDPRASIAARETPGGTGPSSVQRQIENLRREIG